MTSRDKKFALTLIRMAATGIAGGIALIASAKKIGEQIEQNEMKRIEGECEKYED